MFDFKPPVADVPPPRTATVIGSLARGWFPIWSDQEHTAGQVVIRVDQIGAPGMVGNPRLISIFARGPLAQLLMGADEDHTIVARGRLEGTMASGMLITADTLYVRDGDGNTMEVAA